MNTHRAGQHQGVANSNTQEPVPIATQSHPESVTKQPENKEIVTVQSTSTAPSPEPPINTVTYLQIEDDDAVSDDVDW
jgi:hypothetical protein